MTRFFDALTARGWKVRDREARSPRGIAYACSYAHDKLRIECLDHVFEITTTEWPEAECRGPFADAFRSRLSDALCDGAEGEEAIAQTLHRFDDAHHASLRYSHGEEADALPADILRDVLSQDAIDLGIVCVGGDVILRQTVDGPTLAMQQLGLVDTARAAFAFTNGRVSVARTSGATGYGNTTLVVSVASLVLSDPRRAEALFPACTKYERPLQRAAACVQDALRTADERCPLCHRPHGRPPVPSRRLRPCTESVCVHEFETMCDPDVSIFVSPLIAYRGGALVKADLLFASLSARSRSRFEPFPPWLLKEREAKRGRTGFFESKTKPSDDNMAAGLSEMAAAFSSMPTFDTVLGAAMSGERDLLRTLKTTDAYKMVRFALMTATAELIEVPDWKHGGCAFAVYGVPRAHVLEEKNTMHTFHGSPSANWFSITRNGVRSVSGTYMMTVGAAYGAGVYSSPQFATAQSYAARSAVAPSAFETSLGMSAAAPVVAMVSIPKVAAKVIIVEPCDAKVQLRLITVGATVPHPLSSDEFAALASSTALTVRDASAANVEGAGVLGIPPSPSEFSPSATRVVTRWLREMEGTGMPVRHRLPFEDQLGVVLFHVHASFWKSSPKLQKNLLAYARQTGLPDEVLLEFRFPNGFPDRPPFVRVVRPLFKPMTGHVTDGGAICNKALSHGPEGWTSTISIETLLFAIEAEASAGSAAELRKGGDKKFVEGVYSFAAAKDAYVRFMRSHNWQGYSQRDLELF